jgi:hypothetical protein
MLSSAKILHALMAKAKTFRQYGSYNDICGSEGLKPINTPHLISEVS